MGLFDTIRQTVALQKQPATFGHHDAEGHVDEQPTQKHCKNTTCTSQVAWQRTPADIKAARDRLRNRKPEPLSFLSPCPTCQGRDFFHVTENGFLCRKCNPDIIGHPVTATGKPDQGPLSVEQENLMPAEEAPVKHPYRNGNQPNEEQQTCFQTAWVWIREHKTELLAAGWTMAALTRRAVFRCPYGPWGIAWLPVWTRPGLQVTINNRGHLVFTFESAGRTIIQAAHPAPFTHSNRPNSTSSS